MTPEERDRLTRLEARVEGIDDWLRSINEKQDQLLAAANMGRGAWWAIVKLGGVLLLIAGAAAWIYEHWPRR